MVKKKLQTIYASFKKGKQVQHDDPDYDLDDPMYDEEAYSDVVDTSISKKSLQIHEEDLFRFIDFVILENRYWDRNYYDTCYKHNENLMKCPCAKNLECWRRENKIISYVGRNEHASFNCRQCFKTQIGLEGHIRTLSSNGCIYHYALEQMIKSFRLHCKK